MSRSASARERRAAWPSATPRPPGAASAAEDRAAPLAGASEGAEPASSVLPGHVPPLMPDRGRQEPSPIPEPGPYAPS
jgi:hypothetical protein